MTKSTGAIQCSEPSLFLLITNAPPQCMQLRALCRRLAALDTTRQIGAARCRVRVPCPRSLRDGRTSTLIELITTLHGWSFRTSSSDSFDINNYSLSQVIIQVYYLLIDHIDSDCFRGYSFLGAFYSFWDTSWTYCSLPSASWRLPSFTKTSLLLLSHEHQHCSVDGLESRQITRRSSGNT